MYCDEVIRLCSKNEEPNAQYIDCAQCGLNKGLDVTETKCPNVVYFGRAHDHAEKIRQLRYHWNCVKSDPEVISVLSRSRSPKLIAPIPWVNGLESLPQEIDISDLIPVRGQIQLAESQEEESTDTD